MCHLYREITIFGIGLAARTKKGLVHILGCTIDRFLKRMNLIIHPGTSLVFTEYHQWRIQGGGAWAPNFVLKALGHEIRPNCH